ncbi:sensor domain-containing diguanylate cyclase [Pseudomonas sp. PDM13]|uniref:GGDEF domain-containing protein n=1 Tax=Pseudomonas sp. PDM13 TaxID=2769255 RepID=UPI0021DFE8B9|nr:GGDEF domain-containing protein [Pseudomonas sp. PDM13]MCU9946152.1 GGDEF domain-containing protein [Pseudomonas sp. PDM13]
MRLIEELKQAMDPLQGVQECVREEFADWYRQAKVPQIRYVAYLTVVLYFIYAVTEWNVAADQPGLRMFIHGVLVSAALLSVAVMSYRPTLYRPMLALLIGAPIGAVVANLYFNFPGEQAAYFAPEIYLNLMWTFAISGLTLRQALFTASTSTAILLVVTLEQSLQPGPGRLHFVWILASFSFGLLSAFLLEKAHKTMFLDQRRLALNASVDGLTGLWNRVRIDQFFAEEIARAERYGTPFAVILMDIDHFKSVNDTHGHGVGDVVLRQFAALLRDNVRAADKVGRLGGEEFLIVLPEIDAEQALIAARTLQERISGFDFDVVCRKTASFGVTQYRGDANTLGMLERVDRALYRAKANGRNRIEVL